MYRALFFTFLIALFVTSCSPSDTIPVEDDTTENGQLPNEPEPEPEPEPTPEPEQFYVPEVRISVEDGRNIVAG